MALSTLDTINAASTVVMALATVALTWVAALQIRHRAQDKREHRDRLDAVVKYNGILVQRALREAVTALDVLRLHNRELGSWRQQATLAFNFLIEVRRELETVILALVERHAGSPAGIEEMLNRTLQAYDAARQLAGPAAVGMPDKEIVDLYATARKQALLCLHRVEAELHIPALPTLFQPEAAPGAVGPPTQTLADSSRGTA